MSGMSRFATLCMTVEKACFDTDKNQSFLLSESKIYDLECVITELNIRMMKIKDERDFLSDYKQKICNILRGSRPSD